MLCNLVVVVGDVVEHELFTVEQVLLGGAHELVLLLDHIVVERLRHIQVVHVLIKRWHLVMLVWDVIVLMMSLLIVVATLMMSLHSLLIWSLVDG